MVISNTTQKAGVFLCIVEHLVTAASINSCTTVTFQEITSLCTMKIWTTLNFKVHQKSARRPESHRLETQGKAVTGICFKSLQRFNSFTTERKPLHVSF
ncbi:hypothetical protein X975_06921, partial [Stegodyphus mimosarum]